MIHHQTLHPLVAQEAEHELATATTQPTLNNVSTTLRILPPPSSKQFASLSNLSIKQENQDNHDGHQDNNNNSRIDTTTLGSTLSTTNLQHSHPHQEQQQQSLISTTMTSQSINYHNASPPLPSSQQQSFTTYNTPMTPPNNSSILSMNYNNNMISSSNVQPSHSTKTTVSTTSTTNAGNPIIFHNFKQDKLGGDDFEPRFQHQQIIVSSNSNNNSEHQLVFVEQSLNQQQTNIVQPNKKKNKPKDSAIPNNFTFHNFTNPQQTCTTQPPPTMSTVNIVASTEQNQPVTTVQQQKKPTKFTNYHQYQSSNQQQSIQFSSYEPVKAQPSTQIVNSQQHTTNRNITHQFHISQPPLGQFKITDYSNNYAQPLSHIDYMPSNQILVAKNSDSPNPKKRNSTGNTTEGSAAKVIKSSKSIVTSSFPTFTNSDFEGCVPSNTFSINQQTKSVTAAVQERKTATTVTNATWTNNSPPIHIVSNNTYPITGTEQSPKRSNVSAGSSVGVSSSSWTFHSFDQTEQPIKDQSTGLTFHSFNPKKK